MQSTQQQAVSLQQCMMGGTRLLYLSLPILLVMFTEGALGGLTSNHQVVNDTMTVHRGDLISVTCTHPYDPNSGITHWKVVGSIGADCVTTVLHSFPDINMTCGLLTITRISGISGPTFYSTALAKATEELNGGVLQCYSTGLLNSRIGSVRIKIVDGCLEGDLQLQKNSSLEICFDNMWRRICQHRWNQMSSRVACRQLGYSEKGIHNLEHHLTPFCGSDNLQASVSLQHNCIGSERTLQECGLEDSQCHTCHSVRLECQSDCVDGEVRLMNGSTNREGRVEVCQDGHWGTVCNSSQEGLVDVICFQLGFSTGVIAKTGAYAPGYVPISSCSVENGSSVTCSRITNASCDHSMDLGVVCVTYKELYQMIQNEFFNFKAECTQYEQQYHDLLARTSNTTAVVVLRQKCTHETTTITALTVSLVVSLVIVLTGLTAAVIVARCKKRQKKSAESADTMTVNTRTTSKVPDGQHYEDMSGMSNPVYEPFGEEENVYEVLQ